jgi:nucleoside-diphosphate-sugar epimerase
MKILITGGAGNIGRDLTRRSIAEGHQVVIFNIVGGGKWRMIGSQWAQKHMETIGFPAEDAACCGTYFCANPKSNPAGSMGTIPKKAFFHAPSLSSAGQAMRHGLSLSKQSGSSFLRNCSRRQIQPTILMQVKPHDDALRRSSP